MEMVTTCHGMNFPLACSAFFAAISKPPQQGSLYNYKDVSL